MAYSVVDKGSSYFDTTIYTGNGSTNSITGVGFKPDLLWIKERSGTGASTAYHVWFDGVRGVTKAIYCNDTSAEVTGTALTSFNSDGFTLSLDTSQGRTNDNADSYVAWNWLAANSTTTNTSGTITSTISVNITSGFSIVSYTGGGSSATVGHGLGVKPKFIIIKNRNSATNWSVYSQALVDKTGNNASDLILNGTNADLTDSSYFNSTQPTSSVFSIGSNSGVSGSGDSIIAYCFAEVKGFSKFGSYTGNGSNDGTFVYTGFTPAFVMVKRTDSTGNWYIWDNKRNTFNVMDITLYPNSSTADITASDLTIDCLSNGFKIRGTSIGINASGSTQIYMAFASNPFVSSKGLPATAR